MNSEHFSKTVYFLGAGASKASDFELPAMTGFFRKEDFDSKGHSNLHKFIRENFPNIPFKELNLEEMITCLELSLDKFGSFGKHPEVYLYEAKREFDKYVKKRLIYNPVEGKRWCSRHKVIFEKLKDKNTVITLNYDLIVDYTLLEVSPKNDLGNLKRDCLLDRMYSLLGKTPQLWHGERPSLYHELCQVRTLFKTSWFN